MDKDRDSNINSELSKTFFAGEEQVPSRGKNKEHRGKRSFLRSLFRTLSFFLIFFVLSGTAYYYLRDRRIFLDVNLRIENLPAPVPEDTKPLIPEVEMVYLYDFENSTQSWEIPLWAKEKSDHVATALARASFGEGETLSNSLKVDVDFSGQNWSAALVEVQEYMDLSGYRNIFCEIYLPSEAPSGLKAKMILTVGENWDFVEMSRSVNLGPGKWTLITADMTPESRDWRRTSPSDEFPSDIRKMALRVESNKTPYRGPFYIDNISASVKDSQER